MRDECAFTGLAFIDATVIEKNEPAESDMRYYECTLTRILRGEESMKIDIGKFGLKDVPVNPDTVFTFPEGLLAFEDRKRYSIYHEEGKSTVFWLQSLDDPQLAFPIVAPETLDIGYEIELSAEDCALLKLKNVTDAVVLVILYRGAASADAPGAVSAVARSPLVLNMVERLGMQKVLRDIQPSLIVRGH
jgi:flagellar assembly factor FliW